MKTVTLIRPDTAGARKRAGTRNITDTYKLLTGFNQKKPAEKRAFLFLQSGVSGVTPDLAGVDAYSQLYAIVGNQVTIPGTTMHRNRPITCIRRNTSADLKMVAMLISGGQTPRR